MSDAERKEENKKDNNDKESSGVSWSSLHPLNMLH